MHASFLPVAKIVSNGWQRSRALCLVKRAVRSLYSRLAIVDVVGIVTESFVNGWTRRK